MAQRTSRDGILGRIDVLRARRERAQREVGASEARELCKMTMYASRRRSTPLRTDDMDVVRADCGVWGTPPAAAAGPGAVR